MNDATPTDGPCDVIPVILAGGSGTRLWPLSRQLFPKQYHSLTGARSMLVETIARLHGFCPLTGLTVVCNAEHRFLVAEQLRSQGFPPPLLLLEPQGRNTAPAVAVTALHALAQAPASDPVLLFLPADHAIPDQEAFHAALRCGAAWAQQGELVTFGIPATSPETGYGYIQRADALPATHGEAWRARRFVEKPPLEQAQEMVHSGEYFWNSGMFMFRASRILEELAEHAPEVLAACRRAVAEISRDLDFFRLSPAFTEAPAISLDYAVMERARQVTVVPMRAGWSDVGSWQALWEMMPKDASGCARRGDVVALESQDCLLFSSSRMVGVVGVRDLVVVESPDAVLVTPRDRAQEVKQLVDHLRQTQRQETMEHRKVFRPWGHYECVDRADRFQVKRITVHPGAILSLQRHRYRAEHWIVVNGVARVTCGEKVFLLEENQSTYIPVGEKHRLENPGTQPLELIEVQSGTYLGEDDIQRFEDLYGR